MQLPLDERHSLDFVEGDGVEGDVDAFGLLNDAVEVRFDRRFVQRIELGHLRAHPSR